MTFWYISSTQDEKQILLYKSKEQFNIRALLIVMARFQKSGVRVAEFYILGHGSSISITHG